MLPARVQLRQRPKEGTFDRAIGIIHVDVTLRGPVLKLRVVDIRTLRIHAHEGLSRCSNPP
jgi:hypothetical protein